MLCGRWECKGYRQIFTRKEDLTVHLKEERCTGGKTKTICSGGKFNGGDTKFSYGACQWIEAQHIETGKHIHHKIHYRQIQQANTFIINDKGEKEQAFFWFMDMNLRLTRYISFMDVIGMDIHV